jgi:hypothetical protein
LTLSAVSALVGEASSSMGDVDVAGVTRLAWSNAPINLVEQR